MNKTLVFTLSLICTFNGTYGSDGQLVEWRKEVQSIVTQQAQNYLNLLSPPKPEHTLCGNNLRTFLTKRSIAAKSLLLDVTLDRTSEWNECDAELMKLVYWNGIFNNPNACAHYYYPRVLNTALTDIAQIPFDSCSEYEKTCLKMFFQKNHGGHLMISHQLSQAILKLLSQQNQEPNE